MLSILLAEDDDSLRKLIVKNLELEGFCVTSCACGKSALKAFSEAHFDLLITDKMMPIMDGDSLMDAIKCVKPDFPVIILTALETIFDKKKSFLGGADDYLVKPVDFDELILRINALLRRYNQASSQNLFHDDVELIYKENNLKINSKVVDLAKKEFLLLYLLMSTPNRIYSRSQLLDEIWGYDSESYERTVDVHITKLRARLNGTKVEIVSVRGLGYKAVLK